MADVPARKWPWSERWSPRSPGPPAAVAALARCPVGQQAWPGAADGVEWERAGGGLSTRVGCLLPPPSLPRGNVKNAQLQEACLAQGKAHAGKCRGFTFE